VESKAGQGVGSGFGGEKVMSPRELAKECDRILEAKKFRDYPGAKNGLQVSHNKPVKKLGWAVDADIESIRKAGKERVDFLIVHHGIFWGNSALDRKIRAKRIRLAKRLGVAIYSSHLPLDAHPELGNTIGLLRAIGLGDAKRKPFGVAMGRAIGWKVALLRSRPRRSRGGSFEGLGGIRIEDLVKRVALLRSRPRRSRGGSFEGLGGIRISDLGFRIRELRRSEGEKVRRWDGVKVIEAGPKICRRIGIVTGGFGDLDQVVQARLDTLITGEADYPTEVKAKELGINLILGGHRETEVFGVRALGRAMKT